MSKAQLTQPDRVGGNSSGLGVIAFFLCAFRQIVEEKAHSERALLLTVKELEARLAGLDSEKEAVISRSMVNLRCVATARA